MRANVCLSVCRMPRDQKGLGSPKLIRLKRITQVTHDSVKDMKRSSLVIRPINDVIDMEIIIFLFIFIFEIEIETFLFNHAFN